MWGLKGYTFRMEISAFYIQYYIPCLFQKGFCETRIINQTLSLFFVGSKPLIFKPGMPFDAQIAVRYHDQVQTP